jgi:p-hydroxybenzoate 3-monooxygenase
MLHDFGQGDVHDTDAATHDKFMSSELGFYTDNEEGRRIIAMQYVGLPYEDLA